VRVVVRDEVVDQRYPITKVLTIGLSVLYWCGPGLSMVVRAVLCQLDATVRRGLLVGAVIVPANAV